MFYSTAALFAAAAMSGLVGAQNSTCPQYSQTNISFPPECVTQSLRQSWCLAERNTCPMLCTGGQVALPDGNTCDESTLTYNCTCATGPQPNVSNFQQTLPSLVCDYWVGFCTLAHPNDADGQARCQSVKCGMALANETGAEAAGGSGSSSSSGDSSMTTTASSSGATGASGSGSDSSSTTSQSPSSETSSGSSSSSTTGAAVALRFGAQYGLPVVGGGLVALFGLAL